VWGEGDVIYDWWMPLSRRTNYQLSKEEVIMNRIVIAAVSWGNNRLDIFGLGTNNEMFHLTQKRVLISISKKEVF
jgi:hypothetical protein